METTNEKRTVIRFPCFSENEKRIKALKYQSKYLLNLKMIVNYLNCVFLIEVKTKSKYRILNFVFQFIKKTKWHLGNWVIVPNWVHGFEIHGYFNMIILK